MTGPLPLRGAPGPATFGRKKARAFPVGKPGHFETRILCLLQQSSVTVWLQHSRRSAESQAPFRFLHHHSKMGRLPLQCLRYPLRLSAGLDHRQRTTLTTYAMLLPGSSQTSGPAPVFTESAQTINCEIFIPQYTEIVNNSLSTYCALGLFGTVGILCPFSTPSLPNLLRPKMPRPKVKPFYQPGGGLSRWKCSTYRPAPSRYKVIIASGLEAV